MSMSDVGKKMAGSPFWGCREIMVNPLSITNHNSQLLMWQKIDIIRSHFLIY
jgi:hypothetical protein